MRRFFAIVYLLVSNVAFTQVIWENHRSEVYPYIYRMAQKGFIEVDDVIRPVSRQQIYTWLMELEKAPLSEVEKKELGFYLQEYTPFGFGDSSKLRFGKNDANGRWRLLSMGSKDFEMHVDPIISAGYVSGTAGSFRQVSNGGQFWGKAKRWGFQLYYRDYTETGSGIDAFRKESPEQGIVRIGEVKAKQQNFSEIRGHLSYSWKNGSLSFGKDQFLWGYGENGRTVLSDKAPSYAYLRFDYTPFKWMHFQQIHGWLNSNLVDTVRTYGTGSTGVFGDVRQIYRPKFLAQHSLTFIPIRGLSVAVGESAVYSDKWDPMFMIPFMLYKVYDNNRSGYNINAGSNGQLFAQVSSRNHLSKTHLYSTLFIDEIRISTLWNALKRRAQVGFNLGFSVTDVLLPYLTIGAEYTRVNPFVYQNFVPTQRYTHHDYFLGDWMGANADRALAFVKYTPIPKLRLLARVQQMRKGGEGTIAQQYFAEPQPSFLFDLQQKRTDVFFQANYEWLNNLYFNISLEWRSIKPTQGMATTQSLSQVGVSYGLR
ncbi:MAG: hypothetical protein ACO23V_02930 [Chitinophagaceae bacterium]